MCRISNYWQIVFIAHKEHRQFTCLLVSVLFRQKVKNQTERRAGAEQKEDILKFLDFFVLTKTFFLWFAYVSKTSFNVWDNNVLSVMPFSRHFIMKFDLWAFAAFLPLNIIVFHCHYWMVVAFDMIKQLNTFFEWHYKATTDQQRREDGKWKRNALL